jgi:hypothetical protein
MQVDLSATPDSHRKERVRSAISHAKWAARQYAKNLVRQQETIFGYDAIVGAGGAVGIAKYMATYQVFEPLREYAARVCVRLVQEKLKENSSAWKILSRIRRG